MSVGIDLNQTVGHVINKAVLKAVNKIFCGVNKMSNEEILNLIKESRPIIKSALTGTSSEIDTQLKYVQRWYKTLQKEES